MTFRLLLSSSKSCFSIRLVFSFANKYSIVENVFTLAFGNEIQLKRKRRAKKNYSPNHYLVTHGREMIKRNMINSLLTLTKNHQVKVSP